MVTVSKVALFTRKISLGEESLIQVPALKCLTSSLEADDPKINEHALHNNVLTHLVKLSTQTTLCQRPEMVKEVMFSFLNIIGGDAYSTMAFIRHDNAFELVVQDYMRRPTIEVKQEAFDTIHLLF